MQRKPKSVVKWLDDHLEETILMVLIVAITLLTGAQVVMRKLFQSPLTWSEELCRYCFMWTGFISVGYCVRKRCAIRINTFVMLFSKRKQLALEILGNIISLALYSVFLHASWNIVRKTIVSTQTSPAMGIPFYIIYLCTVLGFLFAIVRLAQVIVEDARQLIHPSVETLECDSDPA
ncbi:MAG: TRAP transporter small permease [Planctomycetaceae bacterium]|nr:TRAP transporter small permease [Planctomycetaceae bacterium]